MSRGLQYAGGLNPAQWEAMRYLSLANRHSRTPGALASYLGATKGTTSQTLSALEEKGLLRRGDGVADRRSVQLDLTDDGRKLLASDPLAVLEESVAKLAKPAQAGLEKALEDLLRGLAKHRQVPEFGACSDCAHLCPDCSPGNMECNLLGEVISPTDASLLCVDFLSAPAASADRKLD